MLKLDYKDSRSLHEQISDGIKELIINGGLCENEQLPSVRELSVILTVNPNTVQKAYKQLELTGFIYSIKGKGNFVSSGIDFKDENRINSLYEQLKSIVKELNFLGEKSDEIENFVKEELK